MSTLWRSFLLAVVLASSAPIISAEEISEEAARLELSRVLRRDDRLQEAAAEYQRLIAAHPQRADLRVELGEIYLAIDDVNAANDVLKPLNFEQLDERGRRLVVNVARQRKDFAAAATALREWLEDARDEVKNGLRRDLAGVLVAGDRFDEAAVEYESLVEADPTDVQLRRRFAQTLGWAGRDEEAATQWRASLAATTPDP